MTKRPLSNVAASVLDRLLARSRDTSGDYQFLLQRFAAERFLYRLGLSSHRNKYVLKGAMLFALWGGPAYRPTRHLDFTGYAETDADAVIAHIAEICAVAASRSNCLRPKAALCSIRWSLPMSRRRSR
ncbi:MAG TPA: nucleotidyl transferase AbiEii/AbiGii toxin family protein [Rhizomicrobium sp.]|jgi:hypothetical protein|nr:nucleotidyl transferase AbiEii/AbiGii toxin family protein [Rhizomicrobium sp.]